MNSASEVDNLGTDDNSSIPGTKNQAAQSENNTNRDIWGENNTNCLEDGNKIFIKVEPYEEEDIYPTSHVLKSDSFGYNGSPGLNCEVDLNSDIEKVDTGTTKMTFNKRNSKQDIKDSICQCTECDFTTKTKNLLKNHMMHKHTPMNFKWQCCDRCSFRGKSKGHLKKHVSYHHSSECSVKWLYCNQCSYKAKVKGEITRHQATVHSGPKDFKCDICGGYFNCLENLRRHFLLQHTPDELTKWNEGQRWTNSKGGF